MRATPKNVYTTHVVTTIAGAAASVVASVTAFSIGLGHWRRDPTLGLRTQGMSLGANKLMCGILSMTFISLANARAFLPVRQHSSDGVGVPLRAAAEDGRPELGGHRLFAK